MNQEARDLVLADTSPPLSPIVSANPEEAFALAERMVRLMAEKCKGSAFIMRIGQNDYPKVEWWTTVGFALGMIPREVSNVRLDRDGEIAYEARVEVWRGDQKITEASAICSNRERNWGSRDEFAVRSMAATRATGKAYRGSLSFLAVMAGLQPTPAEEMPREPERQIRNVAPQADDETLLKLKREIAGLLEDYPAEERDGVVRQASEFTNDKGKTFRINGVEDLAKSGAKRVKWLGATLGRLREMQGLDRDGEADANA